MTTLSTIETSNLISLLESTMTTPYQTAMIEGFTEAHLNTIESTVQGISVRAGITGAQGYIAGKALSMAMNNLRYSWEAEEFAFTLEDALLTHKIDGQLVESFDIMAYLIDNDFLEAIDGEYMTFGNRVVSLVNAEKTTMSPVPSTIGINDDNRLANYGNINNKHLSPLVREAVAILEGTESTKSVVMERIAHQVLMNICTSNDYKAAKTGACAPADKGVELALTQQYVFTGVKALAADVAYVTEFKADKRFRLYQAACHGFNGQSSDFARCFQDLTGGESYDSELTVTLLRNEIADMTSLDGVDLDDAIVEAHADPVAFILANLRNDSTPIKKIWNFAKFAMLIVDIEAGLKPYVGVAVGLDATCSGPQIAALLAGSHDLAAATCFSTTIADDAYALAIKAVTDKGLPKLSRNAMKKPYMAIFYGASAGAMLEENTINSEAFDTLYSGVDKSLFPKGKAQASNEAMAKEFHDAVTSSFGREVAAFRAKLKAYGTTFADGVATVRVDKAVAYTMPDGATVEMNYLNRTDINGDIVISKEDVARFEFTSPLHHLHNESATFSTNEIDGGSHVRTSFVNMIQATDALVARLIIKHLSDLGVKNIVSVHDCFRVGVNDTTHLVTAIKRAYKELFATTHNEPTANLVGDLDIFSSLLGGVKAASKPEFAPLVDTTSITFTASNARRLRTVRGTQVTCLINKLSADKVNGNAYFFAK